MHRRPIPMTLALLAGTFATLLATPQAGHAQGAAGVSAPPTALQARAVAACEAHLRTQYAPLTSIFTASRAGQEQDGLLLVTGQVAWREASPRPTPFACIVPRSGDRVVAAMAPPRPEGIPSPGTTPSGTPDPRTRGAPPATPGTSLSPAQLAACQRAVAAGMDAEFGVRPVFAARASSERAAEGATVHISGTGTLPRRPTPVAFTWRCDMQGTSTTVAARSWTLTPR
jgi:hypothetical protein